MKMESAFIAAQKNPAVAVRSVLQAAGVAAAYTVRIVPAAVAVRSALPEAAGVAVAYTARTVPAVADTDNILHTAA